MTNENVLSDVASKNATSRNDMDWGSKKTEKGPMPGGSDMAQKEAQQKPWGRGGKKAGAKKVIRKPPREWAGTHGYCRTTESARCDGRTGESAKCISNIKYHKGGNRQEKIVSNPKPQNKASSLRVMSLNVNGIRTQQKILALGRFIAAL